MAGLGGAGWPEIRAGVRDAWVVGLGLIPLGMAFGLLMTQAGFAWWWTPVFSVVILAGSMEFGIDLQVAARDIGLSDHGEQRPQSEAWGAEDDGYRWRLLRRIG